MRQASVKNQSTADHDASAATGDSAVALSTLELRQEMIEQLYNNPLLEMDVMSSAMDALSESRHQPGNSPTVQSWQSEPRDNSTPESRRRAKDHNPTK